MTMPARVTLIGELEDAIVHGTAEHRIGMLERITDLFVIGSAQYSDGQIALFDDVLTHLVRQIEGAARAALASRLATIPNAPPNLIRLLAFDDAIGVAGPVLAKSERLDDAVLVENAKAKSQQHLLAISRRKSLGETLTDVLIEHGDQQVVQNIAENAGARFSDAGFIMLVARSDGDERLAVCVGSRPEIPRHHFLKLLAKASQEVRSKLEADNPQAVAEIRRVVAEVERRIRATAGAKARDYAAACTLVTSLHGAGRLGEGEVADFANAGKFEETTVALAILCGLSIGAADRAMVQDRAEAVLILARAIGLSWRTAKAILRLRAGQRGIAAAELEQSLTVFERLKPATAQQVVRFHRTRENGEMAQ